MRKSAPTRSSAPTDSPLQAHLKCLEGELGSPLGKGDRHVVERAWQRAVRRDGDHAVAERESRDALEDYRVALRLKELARLPGGSETERRVAGCLAERIARDAGRSPELLEFRQSLWGTAEPLSASGARALLRSRVLAILSREEMDERGIPVLGHDWSFTHNGGQVVILVKWQGREQAESLRLPVGPPQESEYLEWDDGARRAVIVRAGSVLDDVREWAERFTLQPPFYTWRLSPTDRQPAAVWFLTTGRAPTFPAIDLSWKRTVLDSAAAALGVPGLGDDAITIVALSHVSAESVADAFTNAQRHALGRPRGLLPHRPIAVAHFVDARTPPGEPLRFASVVEEWDRMVGRRWRYDGRWRNMRRDYFDGKKLVRS